MAARAPASGLAADDDERALWHALAAGDGGAARERLFSHHANFARGVGRRLFRQRSIGDIDPADVEQLAYVGLMEAIDRFDPARGTPFRAFAVARISGAVIDGIMRMSEAREQISWRHRMRRERVRSLFDEPSDPHSPEQALAVLSELALGLAIGFMLEGSAFYRSDDGSQQPTAYESLAWQDMIGMLRRSLDKLPERERLILDHHYLRGVAFDQLAALLGLSKGRISQLHKSALATMRKHMRNSGHFRLER